MKHFEVTNKAKFPVRLLNRFAAIPSGKTIVYDAIEDNFERTIQDLNKLKDLGYIDYKELSDEEPAEDIKGVAKKESVEDIKDVAKKESVEDIKDVAKKESAEEIPDYSDEMTKAELTKIAEDNDIKITSNDTKKDIIEKLDNKFLA
jgi:hypothetical protein